MFANETRIAVGLNLKEQLQKERACPDLTGNIEIIGFILSLTLII